MADPVSPASEQPPSPSPSAGPPPVQETLQSHLQPTDPSPPPAQSLEQIGHDHDEEEPPPPPPPFHPLFTLVSDSTTRQTHHPRVHYIFADDDPEVLTKALAEFTDHRSVSKENIRRSSSSRGSGASQSHPPPPHERAIVLDLVPVSPRDSSNPTGTDSGAAKPPPPPYEVACASSLSPDWAVVTAKLSPMSSSGTDAAPGTQTSESDDGTQPQPQRLLLRIEGVDAGGGGSAALTTATATTRTRARKSSAAAAAKKQPSQESLSGSGSGSGAAGQRDYSAIVEEFDRRMGILRKVVDAGMERRAKMAEAEALGGDGEVSATVEVEDRHQQPQVGLSPASASESAAHAPGQDQDQAREASASPRHQEESQPGVSGDVV